MEGGSRTSARGVQYAEILLAHTSPFKTQDWRRELAPWKQIKVGLCIFLSYTCREVVQKEEGKRSLLSLMTRIMWVFWCCCYYFLDAPCQRAPSLTCLQEWNPNSFTVKSRFTDTRLIRTPCYYGQFALSLGKESPYIFSKFKPLNTDTPLIGTLSMAPLDFQNFVARSAASRPKKPHYARQTREVDL